MTVDPRMNSVHLTPPRRQEYRRAREALLHARGWQTLAGEGLAEADPASPSHTLIQDPGPRILAALGCWLQDGDSIYPLRIGLNTIGRSADNDVVIEDSYISRRHCAIVVHTSNACELHDTASKNGTYLNGQRLEAPSRIASGDEIRMCDRNIRFVSRPDALLKPHPTATQPE